MLNPTVLTAGQEREQRGGYVLGGSWNGKGTHMWRLKQEKPELFQEKERAYVQLKEVEKNDRPPGFEKCHLDGWLYSKERNAYYEMATRKRFWLDEVENVHKPLHDGEACLVAFVGGAAALPGVENTEADAATKQPAPKHVLVSDLHGASKALKMDFGHLDKPAGALAIIGGCASSSTATQDAAARLLTEKLLRRLASFRGEWSDDMFIAAIENTLAEVAASLGERVPNAAVALAVGSRMVAAATPGARLFLTSMRAGSMQPQDTAMFAPGPDHKTVSVCRKLGDDTTETMLVAIGIGPVGQGFPNWAHHLQRGQPRAASIAHLRWMREHGAKGPLTVACSRLSHRPMEAAASKEEGASGASASGSAVASSASAPPAKKQKTEEATGKVRLRQILLRHATSTRPTDPVRQRPVRRSLEEAEEQMVGVLEGLVKDGCGGFAATCKAISECQSALKGSEFAGDLGWVDRKSADVQKDKTLRVQLPSNVRKVAFDLAVGELSDVITSEQGVHVVQRTA